MARNLLRKLCVPCPLERPKHMKKWFKLVAAKKKDSAVTRNEKRLSLHRKNQMMVKREKRKSKRQLCLKAHVWRVGKENRKHKLCRAQCCDVEKRVSECHHSNPDLWRETVVVSSTGVALAVAAFSHDHSYPQTSSPAPSLSLFQCAEDSLENLLDTCVVDVNFLQEAKSSHDVLFEEVLNHCDVPPDEMFTDIEGDAISNHVVPVPSCWCCLAYSRSAPTQGIFTMAGSTETQLSTCVFPRTRLPTPLALSEKDVQHSVDSQSRPPLKGWMSGEESLSSEDTSASFGVPVFFGSPPATDGASPRVDQGRSFEGAKSGDNWVRVLEQVFKEVAPDNCLGNAGCKSSPPDRRSGNSKEVCGEVGDTVTTSRPRSGDTPSSPQVVGSCVAPHVTHCERVRNIGCGATTHSGSIDSCGGDACLASPPPRSSSCPLLHSVPSFPVQSESSLKASAVASSCRKRRQESGNERSGKRCKTAGQETSWTSTLEADTTTHSSDTHSYQDIPSPPSLSPCWDLPIFHTLPTPLSPLSDDARVMGSDDDVVILGNTLDDVDDKVAVTPGYGAKDEVTSTMEEVERRTGCVTGSGKNDCVSSSTDVQKDMSLRSGDGAVGLLSAYEALSCLDSHLKLFPKALPLSPIANTQFDRCV